MPFTSPMPCYINLPLPDMFFWAILISQIWWALECILILVSLNNWDLGTEKKCCRDLPHFFISGPPWYNLKSVHIAVKEVKATHVQICKLNLMRKILHLQGRWGKLCLCTNRIIRNIEDHFSVTNETAGKLHQFSLAMNFPSFSCKWLFLQLIATN